MNLLDETISLLKEANLTQTAKDTGFSYQWLWQLQKGKIENPSVNKIETLNTYLKNV